MVKTLDHLALELDLLARFVHEWPLGSASQFRKVVQSRIPAGAKPTRCLNTAVTRCCTGRRFA